MSDVTITLSEKNARQILADIRRNGVEPTPDSPSGELLAALGSLFPPVVPNCPHAGCSPTWTDVHGLAEHLIKVHRYADDEYGEDTAHTNAWAAFRNAGFIMHRMW